MSKTEILDALAALTPAEREEVRVRLSELDEENADLVARARADELAHGAVQPKTQAEVFRTARAALP